LKVFFHFPSFFPTRQMPLSTSRCFPFCLFQPASPKTRRFRMRLFSFFLSSTIKVSRRVLPPILLPPSNRSSELSMVLTFFPFSFSAREEKFKRLKFFLFGIYAATIGRTFRPFPLRVLGYTLKRRPVPFHNPATMGNIAPLACFNTPLFLLLLVAVQIF